VESGKKWSLFGKKCVSLVCVEEIVDNSHLRKNGY